MKLILPYPPTVNHYWFRNRNGSLRIGPKGLAFRQEVWLAVVKSRQRLTGRLFLGVIAHPPDHRRRDIDNLLKAVLDALQHGGLYDDDNQIDKICIERGEVLKGGKLIVELLPVEPKRT